MSPTWEEQDEYQRSVAALLALWSQSTSGNSINISQWGGANTTLGPKIGAESVPVVFATDQAPIPVDIGSSTVTIGGTVNSVQSGAWTVNIGSMPLPPDAATETTLALLNSKITACNTGAVTIAALPNEGQQTMANSISVAIASDQSALPITVTGVATEVTLSALNAKIPAQGQAAMAASIPVVIASNQSTVPVSVASIPLPTGAATEATLSALNAKVVTCDTGAVTIAALPNEGQQTMANSISVAIASNQSAVPVSAASLPLPTGAATEATLSAINTKIPSQGQAAMAASVPVVIASNQSTVPVSVASVPLPTGAATEATLSALNAKVVTCDTGAVTISALPNEGQQTMANSISVAIASNQTDLPITASSLPLPTGAATEATLDNIRDTIVATGASSQQVQGPSAVGASIVTGNLFPCGFKDLFNNGVVPTGLDASGVVVMGVLPLDLSLNIQDFSVAGEAFSLVGATANSTATARYLLVNSSGEVATTKTESTTAVTSVAGSVTNVTLLAANTARKKATFYNDSSAVLYLKCGATAANTSFTIKLFPEGFFETSYTGIVDGIWVSATGNCRVTEYT